MECGATLEKERLVAGEDSKPTFGHHYVRRDVQCTVIEPNLKPRGWLWAGEVSLA